MAIGNFISKKVLYSRQPKKKYCFKEIVPWKLDNKDEKEGNAQRVVPTNVDQR